MVQVMSAYMSRTACPAQLTPMAVRFIMEHIMTVKFTITFLLAMVVVQAVAHFIEQLLKETTP